MFHKQLKNIPEIACKEGTNNDDKCGADGGVVLPSGCKRRQTDAALRIFGGSFIPTEYTKEWIEWMVDENAPTEYTEGKVPKDEYLGKETKNNNM